MLLDPLPKLLVDPFARDLAGYDSDDALLRAFESLEPPSLLPARVSFALRHRYAEDEMAAAWLRGVTQAVILGAGLDSLAYRCPGALNGLTIVEVDHPSSQAWKIGRVAELGLKPTVCLRHLAIDFEHQTLGDGLSQGDLELRAPVFISCLGVTQYLTCDALQRLLRDTAAVAAPGSELVLQFIMPPDTLPPGSRESLMRVIRWSETVGEPWLSFYMPSEMEDRLREAGFSSVTHFGPPDAAERYLRGHPGGFPTPPGLTMVTARTG